jgi:hypothetical protein
MIEIVVSHYKEDIRWLKDFSNFKITVYNKFKGENLIPNIGFEAHTYLYHIVNNYDNLSKVTIFSQGFPFDHISFKIFKKKIAKIDKFNFCSFSENLMHLYVGSEWHTCEQIKNFWEKLFESKCPEKIEFYPNSIFSVPSSIIRLKNIEFYKKNLNMISSKMDACIMERIWHEVFKKDFNKIKFL